MNSRLHKAMADFTAAARFITILPAGRSGAFSPATMMPWFPVVGLGLGLIVAVVDALACSLWSPAVAGVIDVVLLAILSGGFHLDGLADTADGLFAHHDRDRALEIMKDSRVGAMGLLAVVMVVALKIAGAASLGPDRFLLLILVPAYSRGAFLFGFTALPYGRPRGTGRAFFDKPPQGRIFLGLVPAVVLSLFLGPGFFVINLGFAAVAMGLVAFYRHRMGCITGDMLGAMAEITEAALFLIASAHLL